MVQLQRPKIATPESAKILYCIHETGSLLVGDFFLPSYITKCIQIAEGLGDIHKLLLSKDAATRNTDQETLDRALAQADDNIRWAKNIRSEDYHQIHTISFLSEWSAQEAGIENVLAAILETKEDAAEVAASKFANGRYDMKDWPWTNEKCLEIAQKLDQKAKEKTSNGGWDISARLALLFEWLGVKLEIKPKDASTYNEASMVRNVIVHRYGRLGANDVERAPHLGEWSGKTIPMTRDRFGEYHQAIVNVHLAIMGGVLANGWK